MGEENGLSLLVLLTGGIFILGGIIMKIFPPKSINSIYGYRTFRSMRNIETWKEGNSFGAKAMIITGIFLLVCGVLTHLFLPDLGEKSALPGIGVIIFASIIMIFATEKHLKRLFDKEGNRKSNH
ncbi:MAG: SdpI family protein [Bacteroidia bacterium]